MSKRLFDRPTFFREVRLSVFRGRLSRQQVRGLEHLLTVWEREYADGDVRHLAYCLATAWHETAHTMLPVRETLARSERQAVARLRKWARRLKGRRRATVLKYARVHPDTGHAYFGRGYVQLTWRRNFRRIGQRLGIDLERNPELAMRPDIAARILFTGMTEGLFTGRRLGDYISGDRCDFVAARQVVNGRDKARLIAGAAEEFFSALADAQIMRERQEDMAEAEREARVARNEPAVNPAPAPPPEVAAGRKVPETSKPAHRSTTIFAAVIAALAQAAAALQPRPEWLYAGAGITLLALAWVIRERLRHAREDGI